MLRTKMRDKIISTVRIDNDLHEVAVNFNNGTEWNVVGRYDYTSAVLKHKSLEKLTVEKIIFQLKYFN